MSTWRRAIRRAPAWLVLLCLAFSEALLAQVSGIIIDDDSELPITGVEVRLLASPGSPVVVSSGDGEFVFPSQGLGFLELGFGLPYDPVGAVNYFTRRDFFIDGDAGVEIRLIRVPENEAPGYEPPAATVVCAGCHVEYHQQWSNSRHAGAAKNPWVLDLFSGTGTPGGSAGYVFRDSHDPGDSGFCATCHAPLEDVFQPGQVMLDEVVSVGGEDGVSCLACHQIAHVNDNVSALHHLGNSTYRFPDTGSTELTVFGPLADISLGPMLNIFQMQFEDSRICAGCHEYNNPFNDMPGQTTYSEWLASSFAQPGPGFRSCQNCHMPTQQGESFIGAGGPLRPGSQRHQHDFVGATPETLIDNIGLYIEVEQQGAQIVLRAEVDNQCGHSFPTGTSIRNALLVLDIRVNEVPLAQVSGPIIPFWGSDDVPGQQPGDYADFPGKGFARVLEGRINGQGPLIRPVLFIDAESVFSDTTIPSGATDFSEYRFVLPAGTSEGTLVKIQARLLYRRAWRALAVTKGWTETPSGMPIEIEVQRVDKELVVMGNVVGLPEAVPVPLGKRWVLQCGLVVLTLLIAWHGLRRIG